LTPPQVSGNEEVVGASASSHDDAEKSKQKKPRENGGKYGFDDYLNAPITTHEVEDKNPGDSCECCRLGKYYYGEDRKQLEFTGGSIVTVKKHIKKALRCNLCGHEKMNFKKIIKWGPEARSALAIHKIYGMPWYRISRIQKLCGIPIAMSTAWEQVKGIWEESAKYIVAELYTIGTEAPLWGTDDTGNKILSVLKANQLLPESDQRACHTTAICTSYGEFKINLYITANRYCRENWTSLLENRKSKDKVVIMTDASSQSLPKAKDLEKTISGVCLGGHGRRKFEDLQKYHPEECGYFLDLISKLYKNEKECKNKAAEDRLNYHQQHSQSIIESIYSRISQLYDQKLVEPNSDLGKAMNYWLNHRQGLTLFLRVAGVPLDTNWVERSLRIMAVFRKACLFFKTELSAIILNDMFSLISTCEVNGVNAFEYLNWIQIHWKEVQKNPMAYLPWCFKNETERIAA
jgi:transposase